MPSAVPTPDSLRSRSFTCELRQERASGHWTNAFGVYHDELRRVDGGWRYARRRYQSLARTGRSEVFPFPSSPASSDARRTSTLLPWPIACSSSRRSRRTPTGRPACTACSTRPRSASRRSPSCTGSQPQRVDDVRALERVRRSREARALALFTIGETPWSAEQRAAILDGVRAGRLAIVSIHSATDSCYGWDDYGALVGARFDGHPWTQTFAADVLDPTHPACAHLGAEWTLARRGVPVPRPAPRRAGAAARARRRARPHAPRARGRRRSATRSRGASPKARAGCSRRASVTSRARGRSPAYLRHLVGRPRLGARRRRVTRREPPPQLLQLGVLAAAARGGGRRRPVPARRSRRAARAVARAGARAAARDARPAPEPVPLDLETTETVDCGTYRRERVVFDTEATMSVPAYLLVPHDRDRARARGARDPRPRSGQGARLRRRSTRSTTKARRTRTCSRREGYVVLAPDLRGFGERADWMPDDKYHCDWDLVCATMAGVVPLERNLWDLAARARRARRAPARRSRRGSARPGSRTAGRARCSSPRSTSACAPRSCRGYLSSWRAAHTIPWNMCGSQMMPGQLGAIEHLDVAVADRAARRCSSRRDRRHHLPGRRGARDRRVAATRVRAARRARRRARARRVRRRPPVARHRGAGLPGEVAVSTIDERLARARARRCPGRTRRTIRSTRSSCTAAGRARRVSCRATTTACSCNPGVLGDDLTVEQGAEAARWCALNALSVLRAELGGLDRIERVLTVLGFVASRAGLRAAARGRRRREPAARRRVRRRRAVTAVPRSVSPRCRAAARSRSRSRSRCATDAARRLRRMRPAHRDRRRRQLSLGAAAAVRLRQHAVARRRRRRAARPRRRALKLMEELGGEIARRRGIALTTDAELDRKRALAGADFVITCFSVGGFDRMQHDIEIPQRYGIRQPIGDSVGPGRHPARVAQRPGAARHRARRRGGRARRVVRQRHEPAHRAVPVGDARDEREDRRALQRVGRRDVQPEPRARLRHGTTSIRCSAGVNHFPLATSTARQRRRRRFAELRALMDDPERAATEHIWMDPPTAMAGPRCRPPTTGRSST